MGDRREGNSRDESQRKSICVKVTKSQSVKRDVRIVLVFLINFFSGGLPPGGKKERRLGRRNLMSSYRRQPTSLLRDLAGLGVNRRPFTAANLGFRACQPSGTDDRESCFMIFPRSSFSHRTHHIEMSLDRAAAHRIIGLNHTS